MEFVYHIVAIRVNETSWANVWRLRFRYLGLDAMLPIKGSGIHQRDHLPFLSVQQHYQ
jgi:hypothetical protein